MSTPKSFANLSPACSLVVAAWAAVSGCAFQPPSADVPPTFIEEVDIRTKSEALPFDHVWVKEGIDRRSFDSVFIKPVRVDLIRHGDWINSSSHVIRSPEGYWSETRAVAAYFQRELEENFAPSSGSHFTLVTKPGPTTLVIDTAFTEVEFAHPLPPLEEGGDPIAAANAGHNGVSFPRVAFALRITDGATQTLLATVADKITPRTSDMKLTKQTLGDPVREQCRMWAGGVAEALNRDPYAMPADDQFALLPGKVGLR